MKQTTHTIETTQWTESCIHCGKVISGSTENQVLWNLSVHIMRKHAKNVLNKKGGSK